MTLGLSWLDREWSTSALERGEQGWDWFSIQLENEQEIVLFQIRNRSGQISPYSAGLIVSPDGTTQRLTYQDFTITPVLTWKSPDSGIVYPSKWIVSIASKALVLEIEPFIPNQEHSHSFRYWEGAVKVHSDNVKGFGYVELTGYSRN